MSQLRFALIRFFLCISFGFDVDLGAAGAIGIIPLYIGKDIDRERGEKNEKKNKSCFVLFLQWVSNWTFWLYQTPSQNSGQIRVVVTMKQYQMNQKSCFPFGTDAWYRLWLWLHFRAINKHVHCRLNWAQKRYGKELFFGYMVYLRVTRSANKWTASRILLWQSAYEMCILIAYLLTHDTTYASKKKTQPVFSKHQTSCSFLLVSIDAGCSRSRPEYALQCNDD